jgi:formate hydrogenlyase subunit 3/multisubunit Na+/H+ antiporter MnhD subunit
VTAQEVASTLTAAALALPLLLAAATAVQPLRRAAMALAPWAALPSLVVAVIPLERSVVELPWAVLGVRLGISGGDVASGFSFLTGCVWLASGWFARSYMAGDPRRAGFWFFFLVTMAGNVGVSIAADVDGFYVFYALMTFAAYGLIVHERTAAARRAGRVYIVMALGGEMMLLAAFFAIAGARAEADLTLVPAAVAASPHRELIVWLLVLGFGVKAGALFLHVWLPLAHPVAPTPASAVLSGAMIAAGALGWLRFLPLGLAAMPEVGLTCALAGSAASFYGVALGLAQRDPKTVLAYSSVSQMGFVLAAIGVALSTPAAAAGIVGAIVYYAVHHALAKAALFLGTGVWSTARSGRAAVAVGLCASALSLSGAPLSSGALAKLSLKHALEGAHHGAWLSPALSLAAVGTTVLMVWFLRCTMVTRAEHGAPRTGSWLPWSCLVVSSWVLGAAAPFTTEDPSALVDPSASWAAAWPVLLGIVLASAALLAAKRLSWPAIRLPPGDVLWPIERGSAHVSALLQRADAWKGLHRARPARLAAPALAQRVLGAAERGEATLLAFGSIGAALFAVLAALAILFVRAH